MQIDKQCLRYRPTMYMTTLQVNYFTQTYHVTSHIFIILK